MLLSKRKWKMRTRSSNRIHGPQLNKNYVTSYTPAKCLNQLIFYSHTLINKLTHAKTHMSIRRKIHFRSGDAHTFLHTSYSKFGKNSDATEMPFMLHLFNLLHSPQLSRTCFPLYAYARFCQHDSEKTPHPDPSEISTPVLKIQNLDEIGQAVRAGWPQTWSTQKP